MAEKKTINPEDMDSLYNLPNISIHPSSSDNPSSNHSKRLSETQIHSTTTHIKNPDIHSQDTHSDIELEKIIDENTDTNTDAIVDEIIDEDSFDNPVDDSTDTTDFTDNPITIFVPDMDRVVAEVQQLDEMLLQRQTKRIEKEIQEEIYGESKENKPQKKGFFSRIFRK